MPYKHWLVHRLGSRWADKGTVGVLHSDVTVFKAETPSYNGASVDGYVARAMQPHYCPIPGFPNSRGALFTHPAVQAMVVETACLLQTLLAKS